ncbi:hypothetical protein EIP91_010628 [Steccherinum ochraceum]|uniref:Uncharacterized protein n=1 Tax=Steccherinum ochraceum TaxID=92696 RepID=A0A4V2MUW8_9APHY|nr:hypothetical protein EIP91_010628 [Steccherinum ochraceum]
MPAHQYNSAEHAVRPSMLHRPTRKQQYQGPSQAEYSWTSPSHLQASKLTAPQSAGPAHSIPPLLRTPTPPGGRPPILEVSNPDLLLPNLLGLTLSDTNASRQSSSNSRDFDRLERLPWECKEKTCPVGLRCVHRLPNATSVRRGREDSEEVEPESLNAYEGARRVKARKVVQGQDAPSGTQRPLDSQVVPQWKQQPQPSPNHNRRLGRFVELP